MRVSPAPWVSLPQRSPTLTAGKTRAKIDLTFAAQVAATEPDSTAGEDPGATSGLAPRVEPQRNPTLTAGKTTTLEADEEFGN